MKKVFSISVAAIVIAVAARNVKLSLNSNKKTFSNLMFASVEALSSGETVSKICYNCINTKILLIRLELY
jgi:hypothetical protein